MSIIPFNITKDGVLTKYLYDRKVIDLSPYINIKIITRKAFEACKSLRELILPESVQVIENDSFHTCTSLETIRFPDKFINIEGNPFRNTKWLKFQMQSNGYAVVCKTLIAANDDVENIETLDLIKINSSAFNSNSKIKKIDLSSMKNLRSIEPYSFYNCTELESMYLSPYCKVKHIDKQTFAFCSSLCDIVLPDGIENIYSDAFRKTPWLRACIKNFDGFEVAVYNNLFLNYFGSDDRDSFKTIDLNNIAPETDIICTRAFEWSGIKEIVFHDGLKKIMNNAFDSCYNLHYINIPPNIEYIGDNAFANCANLSVDLTTFPMSTMISDTAFESRLYDFQNV